MNHLRTCLFVLAAALLLTAATNQTAEAQLNTIADFDFDTPTTASGGFGFSGVDGNNSNPLGVVYNVGGGVPGASGFGGEVRITNGGPGNFAGGGLGSFNLALDPQFIVGEITPSLLEKVKLQFDLSTLNGASLNTPRLQPSGPNSGANQIGLPSIPATTTGFENFTVNFSDLDPFEVEAFANTLNANETTTFTLQFSFDKQGDPPSDTFVTNHAFAVDNILVTSIADLTIPLVTLNQTVASSGSNSNFGGVIQGTPVVTLDAVEDVIRLDSRPAVDAGATTNGTAWVSQFNATLPDGFEVTVGDQNTQFEMDIRLLEGNEATTIFFRHNNTTPGMTGGFGNYPIDLSGLTVGDPEFTTITLPFDVDNLAGFSDIDPTLLDDDDVINFTQFGFTASFGDAANVYEIREIRVANVLDSALLVGDYNEDGLVDAADYTVWRDANGTATVLPNRDPNASGDVGQADYDAWAANYGAGSVATSAAVPEPTALVLLAVGTFIGGRGRVLRMP